MANGPMRSAIIGGGMIANVHHRAIAAAGGVTAGVLGSSPARSAIVAAQWGTKSYASFADLLSWRPNLAPKALCARVRDAAGRTPGGWRTRLSSGTTGSRQRCT
jgi:hypothetical protein